MGLCFWFKNVNPNPFNDPRIYYYIDSGNVSDVETMRNDLAIEYGADFTCSLTTRIFLRIVTEYNYENMGLNNFQVCPFWRIIHPDSKLSE